MVEGEGSEQRTEPVADGKSASSMYEQPEPWHSNPEVQMNELAKPRYKSHLHKSHSAIPSYRNNDLALSRDPRLSKSRQSVRSLKRQAPQPPGQVKLFDNDSERRTLLNPQNIEADVEPLPGSLTPTAPSVTPPRDFHSSADVSPRSSPLDNVRTEPMVPYRRKHNGKSKSTKRNSYDPAAPLSLLTLDSSYTQPPKDSSMLTRNYSGKSNRSTPRRELDSTNQTPDNSRHDFRASPQSNNDFLSSDEEPPSTDRSARYSPAEAAPSDSEQDDMTIMRPKLTPEAKRLRSKPFTGYKGVSPDEHCEEFTNINPGDECEFHK
ncbi:hypothetical protein EB796_013775 [Bugula neritina]|uniref:Uncharacterized protein n=1 Tax=Bugula neritina TaxID=10212 RepID=A0A7J7JPV0_BUGNE|nr:hypothetical protein EB796_013775 [Bugula neritina]